MNAQPGSPEANSAATIIASKRKSRRKKIRLIEPAKKTRTAFGYYVARWPLLGPVIMGTVLAGRGHDVLVYNENLVGSVLDNEEIFSDLMTSDFVGISAMTPIAPRAYAIAEGLRKSSAGPKIVLGGAHATFCPDEAARFADYVVTGEGEAALTAIVEDEVRPGVVHCVPVVDLDKLPLPDFDLIVDFHKSWESVGGKEFYRAPVLTSRGCPYGCSYCSVTKFFGRRCRQRSAEKVVEDVSTLVKKGFHRFFFYDDNFSANFRRNKKVLEGLRGLDVSWNCQTRLDFAWGNPVKRTNLNTELLTLMRKAGGDLFFIGYETIDDATSAKWHKGYKGARRLIERAAEDTRIIHDYGFWIHGMFVVGPDHDQDTLDSIVAFNKKNKIESIQISALTPFPGTDIFNEMRDSLIFTNFPEDWSLYDGTHATYPHPKMGLKRFQEALVEAHKQFYRRIGLSRHSILKFLQASGSFIGKTKNLIQNVRIINRIMKDLEKETVEFLRRVAQINEKYLLPGASVSKGG